MTQNKLLAWPDLKKKLPLLAAALPYVGHFQTRNKGTVCGSIAHADPSSEIPLSLATLEGEVVLRGKRGERVLEGQGFPARHADHRARGRRTDRRGALSGPRRTRRRVPRGGAAARRFRHGRDRRADRRTRAASGSASAAWRATPVVRRIAIGGAKDAVEKLATELEGYEDLHASAELRRDILRNLAPLVIAEAQQCAA